MSDQRYCIGEGSSYQPMDVVKHPPLHPQQAKWGNSYDLLRSGIYYSVEEAEAACIEAAKFEAEEFVVLMLEELDRSG